MEHLRWGREEDNGGEDNGCRGVPPFGDTTKVAMGSVLLQRHYREGEYKGGTN